MYMCMCMSISVYANMHVNMPMYMCVTIYIICVFSKAKYDFPFHQMSTSLVNHFTLTNKENLASSAHPMAQGLRLFFWGRCRVSHADDGRDRLVVAAAWANLLPQQDIVLANLGIDSWFTDNWSAKCQQNVSKMSIYTNFIQCSSSGMVKCQQNGNSNVHLRGFLVEKKHWSHWPATFARILSTPPKDLEL